MRTWGRKSTAVRAQLDPRLQTLCDWALLEVADISLLCSHRNEEDQNTAFANGNSKLRWPNGKHNKLPSMAVDLQPYPMPTDKAKAWASLGYIAGRIVERARQDGIKIRWGGDWDSDGDLTDQNFDDLYHLEIVENADAQDVDGPGDTLAGSNT